MIKEMLHDDLINDVEKSVSNEAFFKNASQRLLELNYVYDTFEAAIIEREAAYPTGLELEKISIAIPHTDSIHIKSPFIFINKIAHEGIEFIQMGTDDVPVKPEYIMVLGITEPKKQVGLLAELIELFSDDAFLQTLRDAKSVMAIKNAFLSGKE
ncbi:PTS sugar transporter subunit IIA [Pseudolactococcus yaeyamensis]